MKQAVVCYSLMGHSREAAQREAKRLEAAGDDVLLVEVLPERKMGLLRALFVGCPAAVKQRSIPLSAESRDAVASDAFQACERITVAVPVWAGFPAPAFNSVIRGIEAGKRLSVLLLSDSGDSSKSTEKVRQLVESGGLVFEGCKDVKQSSLS